ncbi:MAG: hypothetical protein CVT48_03395 [Thermoplasmata archaeon HGW-Thermoplasmata-1]|nr:MAG: hypothetical protein CVT48_03395 [Thermoplasmata archaeon HGW-Thermoplasmata-1]
MFTFFLQPCFFVLLSLVLPVVLLPRLAQLHGHNAKRTASNIVSFIKGCPGSTQKDMCEALGISSALVSWHTSKL